MSSYYVSSYNGAVGSVGGDAAVVQQVHPHVHVQQQDLHHHHHHQHHLHQHHQHGGGYVAQGHFEPAGYADPSRAYHQQQPQQPQLHANNMATFSNQQAYSRYPVTAAGTVVVGGYSNIQNKGPDAYFVPGQQQQPQQHSRPDATLYRPASPMISALAPQHGSPPLNYKPTATTSSSTATTLIPCAVESSSSSSSTSPSLYSAGHPSFQAQHHRGQQQQHLMAQQQYMQQQQHSIGQQEAYSVADYNGPTAEMAYQQPAGYTNGNNQRCSNAYGVVAMQVPSASSAEPVIADLDQLQQQQRQQQQLCANVTKSDVVLVQHSTGGGSSQQPLIGSESDRCAMQMQTVSGGSGSSEDGGLAGDMMDGQLTVDLQQHSPLDGDQLPPLMDGESPPGSLQDSPLYPWMRSQFGNFFSSSSFPSSFSFFWWEKKKRKERNAHPSSLEEKGLLFSFSLPVQRLIYDHSR